MTKNQSASRTIRARWSSALQVLIALWCVVLFLSVYYAPDVRDELNKSDLFREQVWLRSGVTQLMRLADVTGLSAARDRQDKVRKVINGEYTVLVAPEKDEEPDDRDPVETPTAPDELPHRVARRPRRVLIIGASSIQFAIGVELEKGLPRDYDGIRVKRYGQLATGLSRPDFMNWPDKLRALAEPFKPDLIICNFGGNDAQNIRIGEYDQIAYDSPEWEDKYAEKVTEMIDIGKEYGADTVMLGMPIMRSPKFSRKMRRLNTVMQQATEAAGMLFVPTYKMASTPGGEYRTTIKFRGKRGLMRTSDGVHYTRLGARFIIEQVMQAVERRYRFKPKNDGQAVAERHGFESKATGRWVWYTAYVPRDLSAPRPAVVLLVDDSDGWSEWPNFPHRWLQEKAERLKVVLVVPEEAGRTVYLGAKAAVLQDELPRDLGQHLPVSTVSFAGSGRGGLSALAAGRSSLGLLLYRPWFNLTEHREDEVLIEALGDPQVDPSPWSRSIATPEGPLVWLQAPSTATSLRETLGARLLDAGPPASSFVEALEAGLPVLVPPPGEAGVDDIAPEVARPR